MQKQNQVSKVVSRAQGNRDGSTSLNGCSRRLRSAAMMFALASLFSAGPASADSIPTDSVLITKHSNRAADFYEKGNFNSAKDEYLALISFAPNAVEPYEGLLSCAKQMQDWRQVAFAAGKISSLSPERKPVYEFDYGTALYHLNRYDEAIPHLKSALATADIPAPSFRPIKLNTPNGVTAPAIAPIDSRPSEGSSNSAGGYGGGNSLANIEREEEIHKVTSNSPVHLAELENFQNAVRSEFICIAEYQGFDKTSDIRFNSPVPSHWHIIKILKGPPLNKSLPVRYDFHTLSEKQAPPGWRFDQTKMPSKGSKWILFIEHAVPEGDKSLFTTYGGSYGRQPATETNLNELDRLLEERNMKVQGL